MASIGAVASSTDDAVPIRYSGEAYSGSKNIDNLREPSVPSSPSTPSSCSSVDHLQRELILLEKGALECQIDAYIEKKKYYARLNAAAERSLIRPPTDECSTPITSLVDAADAADAANVAEVAERPLARTRPKRMRNPKAKYGSGTSS